MQLLNVIFQNYFLPLQNVTCLKGINLEILGSLFACFMDHLDRSIIAMAKGMLFPSMYRTWVLSITRADLFPTLHSGVSRSEYWHRRHLQTPQIAPHPALVVKHLPAHHAPNWPPLTRLAVLTSGLVPCKTHWPMPGPPRLTAVPIRETTCLPRLDYACPKPIHAKYICYSNYQIR